MEILLLTLFVSLLLAVFFIFMFMWRKGSQEFSCPERESLLPLSEEETVPVDKTGKRTQPVKNRAP